MSWVRLQKLYHLLVPKFIPYPVSFISGPFPVWAFVAISHIHPRVTSTSTSVTRDAGSTPDEYWQYLKPVTAWGMKTEGGAYGAAKL